MFKMIYDGISFIQNVYVERSDDSQCYSNLYSKGMEMQIEFKGNSLYMGTNDTY